MFQTLGNLHALGQLNALTGLTDTAVVFIHGQTDDDRKIRSTKVADAADDLQNEAHTVFQGPTVFVRASVGMGTQELLDKVAMSGV